jgi:glycosyltransferase involved in cell wall biosynthesis
LCSLVESTQPTHLIVATPIAQVIAWAVKRSLPVLPLFADSFRDRGVGKAFKYRRLAFVLNHPSVEIVSNHNLASALDLKRIGVSDEKIVPFDWPALISPRDFNPKNAPSADRPFKLLYVGAVTEAKGVGDLIRAMPILRDRQLDCALTIIGSGDINALSGLADRIGVGTLVNFEGGRDHDTVLQAMRLHDVVLVPSRHAYPEGLPMTLYESLCVRTPLIVSDHPMFALRIRDRENALVFREKDVNAIAACVIALRTDGDLYCSLSKAAERAADDYLCPIKWDRLVSDFLNPAKRKDLLKHALCHLRTRAADAG